MTLTSAAELIEVLRQHQFLEPKQFEELSKSAQARITDPRLLAKELIQRSWLTPYQGNQLMRGRVQDLLLGAYVLLDRLGEGGMGQVFKARHRRLGRVVALKVIRADRLRNPIAVERFKREAQATARLSHPNIVSVYDSDEVNGTHFLAMEYIEGIDLAKLVAAQGPLPAGLACEYIRQAALGLQHAHERGLVHRDIKPHNLLLSTCPDGPGVAVVKILDLGLALIAEGAERQPAMTTLTQDGAIMGTVDYLSPEQALDPHSAGIRADIYSLGCTLYFLLAGHPPYPPGNMTQKIAWLIHGKPAPLEQECPGAPQGVVGVVRKMMARRPEDRYQTPAATADALSALVRGEAAATPEQRSRPSKLKGAVEEPTQARQLDRDEEAALLRQPDPSQERTALPTYEQQPRTRGVRKFVAATAVLLLIGLAVGAGILIGSRGLSSRRDGSLADKTTALPDEQKERRTDKPPAPGPAHKDPKPLAVDREVQRLRQALKGVDGKVRVEAAVQLGQLGPGAKAAVRDLVEASKDMNEQVRVAAVVALGKIGPQDATVVPALIEGLKDEVARVRLQSAQAIGQIGPEAREAVPALVEAMQDKDDQVFEEAARSLKKIHPIQPTP